MCCDCLAVHVGDYDDDDMGPCVVTVEPYMLVIMTMMIWVHVL